MDENFGPTYITITDEDGNDHEVEFISRISFENKEYAAFFPADVEEDDEDANEIIMFRIIEENGEEILETIDDEREAEAVYEKFCEDLFDDEGDEL